MIKHRNMKRWGLALAAAVAVIGLSSCAQYANREHARNLRLGMSKDEVLKVMGDPLTDKKYNTPDVWFYYIETRWWWDFQATRDECLPLVFKDGTLAGWGNEYYYKNIEVTGRTGQAQKEVKDKAEKQNSDKK